MCVVFFLKACRLFSVLVLFGVDSWFLYEDGAFNTYSSGDTAVVFGDDGACRPLSVTMNNKVRFIFGASMGLRWRL